MDFTNSGGGACLASESGSRAKGVKDAVHWYAKYPAIDSFTASFLHAGGRVKVVDGEYHLVGMTTPMDIKRFAQSLKIQGRTADALKRGLIVTCDRLVNRKKSFTDKHGVKQTRNPKSTGYCLPEDVGLRRASIKVDGSSAVVDKPNVEPMAVFSIEDLKNLLD